MANDNIQKLMAFLQALRDPETGCAWTASQSFESLAPQTLEECYELLESIEQQDNSAIKNELGDLLYHVMFYAQIAAEENLFNLDDLAASMLAKHEQRMPPKAERIKMSAEEINQYWEQAKAKAKPSASGLLDNIPKHLPALTRANKLQQRAASVGFDWDNLDDVTAKIHEELGELQQELQQNTSTQAIRDEAGDLLFAVINLIRHLDIDPEAALRSSNDKFQKRFQHIENTLKSQGKTLAEASLDTMEQLWQQAKNKP